VSRALVPELRQVAWPDKFEPELIDKYDDSSNPEELFQVNHMIIEAAGGDYQMKANYLLTALSGVAISCLVNLPEGTIYN
jgi:hypothetical protein